MADGPSPTGPQQTDPKQTGPRGNGPQGFRFLGETVRCRGWRIQLTEARFAAPDGSEFERDVVRHPGAVAVVAVTDNEEVLLVRQYRGTVDRELLEIPAGTRDVEGEPPEETARRELLEEVGVNAGRITLLGTMLNSPGFCDQETRLYLATELEAGSPGRHGVEEEHMEVVTVALTDVDELVATGDVIDGQTLLGLLLARDVLARD